MSLIRQLDRLLEAGLADVTGRSPAGLATYVAALPDEPHSMLAVHPAQATARQLAPLLRRHDKPASWSTWRHRCAAGDMRVPQ